ncbi:MAG: preprotein translocase subunit SecY [Synergistaceae bacterium]|nr:preprotein translocase subunit SecY [Synergistaceae bacterium]
MIEGFRDAFRLPDLKRRILFVIGALFIFRLGAYIPTPGINAAEMSRFFASREQGMLGFLNLLTGGALSRFGIFALGVGPYINSSIVMQLLTGAFPALAKMQKDEKGEGRKKITQYTRIATIFFALVQAVGLIAWLRNLNVFTGGYFEWLLAVSTVTTGAVVVMWLGEVMSDHGIGNGTSMLIYAGIVARLPRTVIDTAGRVISVQFNIVAVIAAVAVVMAVIVGCIYLQEGKRRLPVQYAKRQVGNKVYEGRNTFIPLPINPGGVIPIIFATSVLLFPYTIASFFEGSTVADAFRKVFSPDHAVYMVIEVLLIIAFSYFYKEIAINPGEWAGNMKDHGGAVSGYRPGRQTADYIVKVMNRITLCGALALSVIQLIPNLISQVIKVETLAFGGTAIIIVVGVALDTVQQIESQLLARHFEGIVKRQRKSGRLL